MELRSAENWMRTRRKKKTLSKWKISCMCTYGRSGYFYTRNCMNGPGDESRAQRMNKNWTQTHILRAIRNKSPAFNVRCEKWCNTTNGEQILFQWLVLTTNCVFTHIQSTDFIDVLFATDMKNFHCIANFDWKCIRLMLYFFSLLHLKYRIFLKICKHYVREQWTFPGIHPERWEKNTASFP